MMRSTWIVLVLLLELSIVIAAIEASVGSNDSVSIGEKEIALRSHRVKRFCCCPPKCLVILLCCGGGQHGRRRQRSGGATVQKEMFRNWWLNIPLLLLPMSMSWMKSIFY
uniref:Secreted protein n=1 Tax=Onchocerca volvulus TaxID=6282 RepID=A0A8R1TN03_ONCVO